MNWDGAGTIVGAGTALFGTLIGFDHALAQNLVSFAMAGAMLDGITKIPKINIRRWWGAIICAVIANLVQFAINIYSSMTATVTKHFLVVGIVNSVWLHVGFGVAAGFIGWFIFSAGQTGYRHIQQR